MINWDDLQKIDFPWKKRKGFFPVNTLNGKNNFMPLITTRTDLTAVLGIYLDVPDDKLREQIIFTHYLAQYTKAVSKEPLAVWIHGRDGQKITGSHLGSIDPWDFVIETNEGRLFNVEIVSIAESTRKYSYLNDMKRFRLQLDKPKIPLSMLKKLDISFPDQKVAEQIQNYERQNIGRNDLVANPFFEQDSRAL